jgi:acyl-CoA thioesterase
VILAYLSDMTLLDTSTFAHGRGLFDPDIQAASLDHAMWFHRPHPLDGWLSTRRTLHHHRVRADSHAERSTGRTAR